MLSYRSRFLSVGLALVLSGTAAWADTYEDTRGFSFTYPDGWVPITRDMLGDVNNSLPSELKSWLANNEIDLSRIAVMLAIDEPKESNEFRENLNVVVEAGQISLDAASIKRIVESVQRNLRAAGVKIEEFGSRVGRAASRDVLILDFLVQYPGASFPARQRQYMIPGGARTYIVTCSAAVDQFEKTAPTFEKILESFRAPMPIPDSAVSKPGFDWGQVLNTGIIGGVVGGIIGGLATAVNWFKKKRRAEPEQEDTEND